ncbi:AcrR family transcriptional regulator [Kibdelosporangium banguiense]|uniref:AcrR family transcriptional regulator n=1 Tax=Kibdelosporangium banguiense TaxID=1365924 RepID=A0ABS4TTT7_9PSEU|nr:TetR/AcrR family transcriptional regulator [Kibdelosporangium banguiense]MBP2327807.1 AcrR family transcriptional regulator [Kibdelosporangium banguiense]
MVRGIEREQAILDATIALLGEVGYAALTMDAVAARACASKTTIYRRWSGKPELVRAALDAYDTGPADAPDTGTLRGDLLTALQASGARVDDRYAVMMTGLLHAMRVEPELADLLRAHVADEELSPLKTIVDRAVGRGELPAGTTSHLAHQVAEGQLLRRMLLGEPLDDDYLAGLVDDLLVPLLTRRFEHD